MSVWSVSDVTQGIAGSLRKAAEATGAGFDYLVKTAMRDPILFCQWPVFVLLRTTGRRCRHRARSPSSFTGSIAGFSHQSRVCFGSYVLARIVVRT